MACSSSARSCRCSFSSMPEFAAVAPNEVLVEDRMFTAASTLTLKISNRTKPNLKQKKISG